jgi:hypothetical protein
MVALMVVGLIGLGAAMLLPSKREWQEAELADDLSLEVKPV